MLAVSVRKILLPRQTCFAPKSSSIFASSAENPPSAPTITPMFCAFKISVVKTASV